MKGKGIHSRARRGGFTLIEAALTTVIVGTGVLAIVAAQQAYHRANDWAQRSATAQLLANEVRELTMTMPMYHPIHGGGAGINDTPEPTDIADYEALVQFGLPRDELFGGQTDFSPPISGLGEVFDDDDPDDNYWQRWRQRVEVQNVRRQRIDHTEPEPLGSTDTMRVHVEVGYRAPGEDDYQTVTHLWWVVGR